MANVAGVNGITGYIVSNPQATPFEQQGGIADPKHAIWGEEASPYPWENVPMGPYPGLINPIDGIIGRDADSNFGIPAGSLSQDPTADVTPSTGAAPFSNENPLAPMADQLDTHKRAIGSRRQLLDSLRVHAMRTGAGLKRMFLLPAEQDSWNAFFNAVPGQDNVPVVPISIGAVAGGYGTNDHRSNPGAKVNSFDLATSHRHRRYATGSVPGNYLWLKARSRPMVRSFTSLYNFPTSGAFAGDDPGASFSTEGAILYNPASEYVPPTQPYLASPSAVSDSGVPDISYY